MGSRDEVVEEFAEDDDVETGHAVDVVFNVDGDVVGKAEEAVERGGEGEGAEEDVEEEGYDCDGDFGTGGRGGEEEGGEEGEDRDSEDAVVAELDAVLVDRCGVEDVGQGW